MYNIILFIVLFTACSFMEKPCTDGHCIREEWICDGHVDCIHATDEANCSMSNFRKNVYHFILEGGGRERCYCSINY